MPTRLKHDKHGFHNAYSNDEVLELKSQGWNIIEELQKIKESEEFKNIKPNKLKRWQ